MRFVMRSFFPRAADKIGPALGKVAQIAVYVLALPIHVLGPRDAQGRTTLAMESGARNFGLAVTIGVLNFSREEALPVFIPYMILFVVIFTIYLKWRKNATTHAEIV
jgi:predicted Na+-dependent transporter